jgi:phosphoribosyl 1,2-cyclic phosphodiesterase
LSIFFQSLLSSSSGNCLALWTPTSSILIDCGVRVQRDCRALLEGHRTRAGNLDAVIVSHSHGDHMAYGSLRVLQREGIAVHAHKRVVRQLRDRHHLDDWDAPPRLRPFPGVPFEVGDFRVMPMEVPHAPGFPNFGFVITARDRGRNRRIVVCTDFHDYADVLAHFVGADFIFVEANHDLELLRLHPNHASAYHLSNVKTASLLCYAVRKSDSPPSAVMLGHLSEERNRKRMAVDEVKRLFERQRIQIGFTLDAAPAHRSSAVVEI